MKKKFCHAISKFFGTWRSSLLITILIAISAIVTIIKGECEISLGYAILGIIWAGITKKEYDEEYR